MAIVKLDSVTTIKIQNKWPAMSVVGTYKSSGDDFKLNVFKSNKELCAKLEQLTPGEFYNMKTGKNSKGYTELQDVTPYTNNGGGGSGGSGGGGNDGQFRTPDQIMRTDAINAGVAAALELTSTMKTKRSEAFEPLMISIADSAYRYIKGDPGVEEEPMSEEDIDPNADDGEIPDPPEV